MLTESESNNLYNDIRDEQKKTMKDILNSAKLALDENKFDHFKKMIFNSFGRSGLETSIDKIIRNYTKE